jgi:hypothetical protein
MINFKQEELAQHLFDELKEEFSEISLLEISEQPDHSIWVKLASPKEDGLEIIEASGKKSMEILLNHGYHILVMPFENVK